MKKDKVNEMIREAGKEQPFSVKMLADFIGVRYLTARKYIQNAVNEKMIKPIEARKKEGRGRPTTYFGLIRDAKGHFMKYGGDRQEQAGD